MEKVAEVILFFFKAESVVILLYLLIRGMQAYKMGSTITLTRKTDTHLLVSLSIMAILASLMYAWYV